MKTRSFSQPLVISAVVSLSLCSLVKAGPNRNRPEKILQQDAEERYVIVTGSRIPQKVKVRSIGTDSAYNVRIYTHRELQSTGRQTTGEALATLDPSIQFTGRH